MLRDIGKIVASARKRLNLDVQGLATRASVEAAVLSALEKGKPGITTTEIDRIAEQLELDPAALLLGRDTPRPKSSIFLRHQGHQDFDFDAESVLDEALEAGRSLRFLNGALKCTPSPRLWSKTALARVGRGPAAQEGYRLDNALRQLIKLPSEPLPDVGELLEERFEIAVVVETLPSAKMTAVSVRDAAGAAAIVLNASDAHRSSNTQLARVYVTHELAHIMYDPSDGGLHIVIDREDAGPQASTVERAEQRAKAFAAEFLMPLHGLLDLLGTPEAVTSTTRARDLVSRARKHFSTPWEIAANHLNHHGFISNEARETLLHQRPKDAPTGLLATRLPDPGASSIALSERVRRAHRDGLITDGQVRVALKLAVDDPLPADANPDVIADVPPR